MFFTVVIPTHKRKQLLQELLKSLDNQDFPNHKFQIKIIATENDEAFSIDFSSFKSDIEILFIPNDPTQGRSASAKRNFGAQIADGEWIAFTDDDCLAHSNWLKEAHQVIQNSDIQFLEGSVNIPKPDVETFTYKGIKRLSRPGGFQTCNMFYKKSDFLELGGFDPNFPYYLEDTDLAWTFKDAGRTFLFAENSIISHPVPPAAPHKMLESALRMEKLPYLYKKHPTLFKESKMRAMPRPYLFLVLFDFIWPISLFISWQHGLAILILRLLATDIIILRMLRGCHFKLKEMISMYYYLLICPIISLTQLIKGNLQNRVWIFLK